MLDLGDAVESPFRERFCSETLICIGFATTEDGMKLPAAENVST
jgi:hypothetical protein